MRTRSSPSCGTCWATRATPPTPAAASRSSCAARRAKRCSRSRIPARGSPPRTCRASSTRSSPPRPAAPGWASPSSTAWSRGTEAASRCGASRAAAAPSRCPSRWSQTRNRCAPRARGRVTAMARLLVVDDKDSIRTMLDMRLTAEGHAVEQAENVATADRALSSGDFDVVITDLRMGKGGDGLDVLRKVKERQARAVHAKSPRAQQPFIPVNCGAIPEGLIESELFGHVKGAFTGAQSDKAGLFQTAEGGTLFLDEIAELPTPLQVKLLRAIQDRRIRQVGGTEDVEVDVRIVAATNRDLPAEVRAGRFREDLYYRLNVVQIRVPPLRDRREDILLLADHFLRRFGAEHRRPELRLSREARRRLDEYGFPGNVRELENLIERAVALSDGDEVTLDALPAPLRGAPSLAPDGPLPPGFSLEAHLAGIERELIDRALAEARGVKKDAAAKLGLTFRQFRHRLKKLSGEENGNDPEGEDFEPT